MAQVMQKRLHKPQNYQIQYQIFYLSLIILMYVQNDEIVHQLHSLHSLGVMVLILLFMMAEVF